MHDHIFSKNTNTATKNTQKLTDITSDISDGDFSDGDFSDRDFSDGDFNVRNEIPKENPSTSTTVPNNQQMQQTPQRENLGNTIDEDGNLQDEEINLVCSIVPISDVQASSFRALGRQEPAFF